MGAQRHLFTVSTSVQYANTTAGELSLSFGEGAESRQALTDICREVARQAAFLAKRYEVARATGEFSGRQMLFVGQSDGLRRVEEFIERAAQSEHPIVIRGEFGTEKTQTAAAIHVLSGKTDGGPLVEVNCAAQRPEDAISKVLSAIEEAGDGTVFFNGIDELHPNIQSGLPECLLSRVGQWMGGGRGQRPARIIASTTRDLHAMVREGRFSKSLLTELDFLSVQIPPLRDRVDDIALLMAYYLHRDRHAPDLKITDELIAQFGAHAWPENLFELERVVTRLSVMSGAGPISRADIARYTPWILEVAPAEREAAPGAPEVPPRAPPGHPVVSASRATVESWVGAVSSKELSNLRRLHPSLQKALVYLSENFAEPIALGQLAKHACVSPSHLAYLFKNSLGISFKPFLGRLRVEKAKERLMSEEPVRITDVAMDVGFLDLSHFEKLFKRFVGVNPREYRRRSLMEPHTVMSH